MKNSKSWFKTNLGYGLVVIVPLAILLLLLAKIVELLQMAAAAMELETALGAGAAIVLAFALVLLACVGIGAIVRTRLGTMSFQKVEQMLLRHIPGYELLGNILKGFAQDQSAYPAVMLQLHGPGSAVFGLVMEEHDNGVLTVFVPSAPALTVGTLHVVEQDRVTFLETSPVDVANCIRP
jgi:uncharacterized membrane protein